MNLYQMSSQYQSLMQNIIESDEITVEQLQSIESVNDSIEEKAKAMGALIKNMEAEYKAIQEAIMTMEERAIILNNKIENIKDYLKINLEKCEIKEVKSPWFDIKIKMNPASVVIKDENLIPTEYFKETLMRKVDKSLISQSLKNNIMIPGVLLERRTRLEIK